MTAKKDDRQPSFSFEPEPPTAPAPLSFEELLIEQIARDSRVLREEPLYHVPSREFFEERIASFKAEVLRLRGER